MRNGPERGVPAAVPSRRTLSRRARQSMTGRGRSSTRGHQPAGVRSYACAGPSATSRAERLDEAVDVVGGRAGAEARAEPVRAGRDAVEERVRAEPAGAHRDAVLGGERGRDEPDRPALELDGGDAETVVGIVEPADDPHAGMPASPWCRRAVSAASCSRRGASPSRSSSTSARASAAMPSTLGVPASCRSAPCFQSTPSTRTDSTAPPPARWGGGRVEPVRPADERPGAERRVRLVAREREVVDAGCREVDAPVRQQLCGIHRERVRRARAPAGRAPRSGAPRP